MFIRRVRTGSGAVAVQVAYRQAGRDKVVKHLGSAHSPEQVAALEVAARQFIDAAVPPLPLDWDDQVDRWQQDGRAGGQAVVHQACSRLLWQVLEGAWAACGLAEVIKDEAFKELVLARLIEPASKAATPGILTDLGLAAHHVDTYYAALARAGERDYRGRIEKACVRRALACGDMSLLLYDVTTLYFEAEREDEEAGRQVRRKVGLSKERRVDPQIVVGLLVDRLGNPLRVHAWSGNYAEKNTIVPLVVEFMDDHALSDFVVVADAGMLSRANITDLDQAGIKFIVGARQTRAPLDLESHLRWHGDAFSDGQVIDTVTPRHASSTVNDPSRRAEPVWQEDDTASWRAVWQFTQRRWRNDTRTLNKQRERAMSIIEGTTSPKKARFVSGGGPKALTFNETTWQRANAVAGLKGYVTNIPARLMSATEIIASYHELWHVEQSFRMSKHDLAARPIFHRNEQAIDAHLTIVIAALAISRYLHATTGTTAPRIVRTLKPLQHVTIALPGGHTITARPSITPQAQHILDALNIPGGMTH